MKKTIYALGFFDGVHLGHQALLRRCSALAEEADGQSGAVSFLTHPESLLCGSAPGLINTVQERQALLHRYVGQVVMLPFDEEMRNTPWRAFLERLCRQWNAGGFVCGDDFRFGRRGEGNAQMLRDFCGECGLPFARVDGQMAGGSRISSSRIRPLIADGKMEQAAGLLGHPHMLTGAVIHGQQLGRRLGIPTANLALSGQIVVPRHGVYAAQALIDGKRYDAVTNIGTRPTVDGKTANAETWVLDFAGDLYDRDITLELYKFLRPEQKFPTLEALRQAVLQNASQTRQYFDGLSK